MMSHASYNDFTFETYIKYDPELAKQSDDDNHLQQRSGIRILFSNGKYWHIDLMLENGKYVVQYGKITGDNSIFNWKNVHTLTADQAKKYTGNDGIKLTVKRVGNKAAICLDDTFNAYCAYICRNMDVQLTVLARHQGAEGVFELLLFRIEKDTHINLLSVVGM